MDYSLYEAPCTTTSIHRLADETAACTIRYLQTSRRCPRALLVADSGAGSVTTTNVNVRSERFGGPSSLTVAK
jgi:hypothetical protein